MENIQGEWKMNINSTKGKHTPGTKGNKLRKSGATRSFFVCTMRIKCKYWKFTQNGREYALTTRYIRRAENKIGIRQKKIENRVAARHIGKDDKENYRKKRWNECIVRDQHTYSYKIPVPLITDLYVYILCSAHSNTGGVCVPQRCKCCIKKQSKRRKCAKKWFPIANRVAHRRRREKSDLCLFMRICNRIISIFHIFRAIYYGANRSRTRAKQEQTHFSIQFQFADCSVYVPLDGSAIFLLLSLQREIAAAAKHVLLCSTSFSIAVAAKIDAPCNVFVFCDKRPNNNKKSWK